MNYRPCSAKNARETPCWNAAMLALREDELPLCWPHYAKALVDASINRRKTRTAGATVRLVETAIRGQFR